jgi:hypothetical protein
VKLGEVLSARSIEPFEGGRWRLRGARAKGYGNSVFFWLQSIDFAVVKKIGDKRKSQLKRSPYCKT